MGNGNANIYIYDISKRVKTTRLFTLDELSTLWIRQNELSRKLELSLKLV